MVFGTLATMKRTLRSRNTYILALACSLLGLACEGSDETQQEASDRLGVGTASVALELDGDGCLRSDVDFTSSTGVAMRLPSGCPLLRDGVARDRLTLRVRPEPIETAAPGAQGAQAAYRLALEDEDGNRVRASFDLPLEIRIPLPPETGGWRVEGFVDGREWSEEIVEEGAVGLDKLTTESPSEAILRVRQTGVARVVFTPPVAPTGARGALAKGGVGPPAIVPQRLTLDGPADLPLCSWSVFPIQAPFYLAGTYLWTGVALGTPLIDVAESVSFSGRIAEEDGQAVFVLETLARNLLFAEVVQCGPAEGDAMEGPTVITEGPLSGGCAETSCPDDLFVGVIRGRMTTPFNNVTFWTQLFSELEAELDLPERAVLRGFQGTNDSLTGIFNVLRFRESVPQLIDRLPGDWSGVAGDRTVELIPPAPITIDITVSGEGEGQGNVASDLEPILSCDVPPLTCNTTYLALEGDSLELRATANEESVFAGWEGCPEPILDACVVAWDDGDTLVEVDVTARFELADDGACNSAYGDVAGYLPCSGAPANQCKFYAVLDGVRSCIDACTEGGGVCLQAVSDVADGCSGTEPRACDDTANDRICFCTLP